MSYKYRVLKDNPIGYWPLDESSGPYASDLSGGSNDATYYNVNFQNILPLVSGAGVGTTINTTSRIELDISKNYVGQSSNGSFADKYSSDNDFTLEVWIKQNSLSSAPIFADISNNIGLFWDNGNITFKLDSESLTYTVPYTKQAMHIVARYFGDYITLHVNGFLAMSKDLNNFQFSNNSLALQIGPAQSGSFIVDSPAIYRYALSEVQIRNHYASASHIPPVQIVYPDSGHLFSLTDKNLFKSFSFTLPYKRSLATYSGIDGINYDPAGNFLNIARTESAGTAECVIEDYFNFPNLAGFISSKVEWHGDNGITVEVKTDSTNYIQCENGQTIPQFIMGDGTFSNEGRIYYRITIQSSDTSKYNPKLEYLGFYFFSDKEVVSDNSGDYISTQEPTGLSVDTWDYDLGTDNYRILSRHPENGLKAGEAGFCVNTKMDVSTIEFFFTPVSLNACTLISGVLSWNQAGAVTKNNISKIYINGIDKTTQTTVSNLFQSGELHHVIIVLNQAITEQIWFNITNSSGVFSNSGPRNLYKYIAIYPEAFSLSAALSHFNMYIDRDSYLVDDSAISVTEIEYEYHDNDWRVVKSK